jgi:hypothetical protein
MLRVPNQNRASPAHRIDTVAWSTAVPRLIVVSLGDPFDPVATLAMPGHVPSSGLLGNGCHSTRRSSIPGFSKVHKGKVVLFGQ